MRTQSLTLLKTSAILLILSAATLAKKDCPNNSKKPQSKLICYYSKLEEVDGCYCSHVILPPSADVKGLGKLKDELKGVKVFVSVSEFNEGLINLLKSSKVDGLEINLRKLSSKNDIADFISTVKTKLGGDLDIVLSVPSRAELVAKYFDFKALSKNVDMFILRTAFLGASTNVTFHPSRLSGFWDMQNTDSVVDLVTGLGAPLSKLVITAPVQAFQFTLQNEDYTAPGSPAVELKTLNREELCQKINSGGNWTLERDEDQAGPYIFSKKEWIAFEDEKSIDIKAKYSRIRGLAGIALKDLSFDHKNEKCGPSILESTYNGLSRQSRAPRGAVLHSLEREMLENPGNSINSVHLSPFRISRVIDTEGKIHVVRQDSRTEFQCSRQGYFVHPRSCNRFYRCVKFNQQTEDFNVFEFDCPAGLAFDERVEVCVWPGSLPHGTPCSGSSEIAPVPKTRFECPSEPGYYADPENCRWFFACLDHGKTPLTPYEFRCPYGLAFDGERLVCEWPWLVSKCGSAGGSGSSEFDFYGGDGGYNLGYNQGYGATGQGVHGTISPNLILQNYDGLGQLGTIKLGGLQAGAYERPISKIYSTAGAANGLGYQNADGYIVGNGLGQQAIQSLQHAGLLKVNNGAALSYNTQGGSNIHDGSSVTHGQHSGGFLNLEQQQNLNHGGQGITNGGTHYGSYNQNLGANVQYVQGGSVDSGHFNSAQSYAQGGSLHANGINLGANAHGYAQEGSIYAGHNNGGQTYTHGASIDAGHLHTAQNYAQGGSRYVGGLNHGASIQGYTQEGSVNAGHLNEGQIYAHGTSVNGGNLNTGQSYVQGSSVHAEGINLGANAQGYAQQGSGQIYAQNSYAQGGYVQSGLTKDGSINLEGNVQGYAQDGLVDAGHVRGGQIYTQNGYAQDGYVQGGLVKDGSINLEGNIQGYAQEGLVDAGHVSGGQVYPQNGYAQDGYVQGGLVKDGSINLEGNVQGYPQEGLVDAGHVSGGQVYSQNGYAHGGYVQGGLVKDGSINLKGNVQGYAQDGSVDTGHVSGGQVYSQNGYAHGGYVQDGLVKDGSINLEGNVQGYAQGGSVDAGHVSGGQIYTQNDYAHGGYVQGGLVKDGRINVEGNVQGYTQGGSVDAGHITGGQIYTQNGYAQGGYIQGGLVKDGSINVEGNVQGSVNTGHATGGQIYAHGYQEGSVTGGHASGGQIYTQNSYAQGGYVQGGTENAGSINLGTNIQGYAQEGVISTGHVSGGQIYQNAQGGSAYSNGYQNSEGHGNNFKYSGADWAKSYQSITQTHGVGNQVDLKNTGSIYTTSNYDYNNNQGSHQANLNLNNLKGTTAYQVTTGLAGTSTSAYDGVSGGAYNAHENEIGHVSIVGGGYSAVGSHGSGVHVTNNGENSINLAIPTVSVSTATPVTTVTSIPTVTAVPFPQTHSTTYHKGGVVANIPELQYRVHSNGEFGLQNLSNYASVVASTPSPFVTTTSGPISHSFVQTYSESGGYSYNKPNVNVYVSSTPKSTVQESYVYNKPSLAFEETPIKPHIDTVRQGYIYEKPVVPFEESPQIYVSSTPKPQINVVKQGYVYEKPAVKFEETPVNPIVPQVFVSSTPRPEINVVQQGYVYNKPENPFTYSTTKPTLNIQTNQHGATSYQTFNKVEQHGYSTPNVVVSSYSEVTPKPIVSIEQKPQIFVSTTPLTPTVTPGYVYQKPASPQIISQFHISDTKSDSYNHQSNQNTGYYYEKPGVAFEEKPLQPVQPTVPKFTVSDAKSNSFNYNLNQNTGGYHYEKPRVVFEDRPTYYNQNPVVHAQPVVELYKQPEMLSTYTYQQPAVYKTEYKSPVSSYTYQNVALNSVGYTQPKQPEITYVPSTTYRPQIVEQYQTTGFGYGQTNAYHNSQQNYVATEAKKCNWCNNLKAKYNYPKPNVVRFEDTPQKVGYDYPKLQIKFEDTPVRPVVFEQRPRGYNYPKPEIKFEETPVVYTTPRPVVIERKPNAIGYNYPKPNVAFEEKPVVYSTPKPVESTLGYNYPKPAVVFEDKPKPVVVSSFSYVAPQPKPTEPSYSYVASTTANPGGYEYPVPQVPFVENPINYENKVPIVEEPFVKKTAYVTGQNHGVVVENYEYQGPQQVVHNYVQSTPKPTFVSTLRTIAAKKLEPVTPASYYYYDSRLTPTPQPEVNFVSTTATPIVYQPQVSTNRPVSKFSFSSLDDQYQYNQYQQDVKYKSEQPARVYLPVTSTELPEVSREYLPVQISTQAPSKEYLPAVEPVRQYLPSRQRVKVTTVLPPQEYLPAVEPTREYLPVRQRVKVVASTEAPHINIQPVRVVESYVAPNKEYLPVKVTTPSKEYLPVVEVTTPAREYLPVTPTKEYLPVRQRVRITSTTRAPEVTTLSREYLPQRQRVRLTSTVTPVVTPVRTIIKQNDAHPLLSAKLGAQCTCISPSLNLRKNQKLVIVTTDEEDYSDNNDNYDSNEHNVVENYSFEPEKVVEITPTPEVYIKSSTGANEYLPPRRYEVRKRVRVRPTSSPVTEVSEIFLRKDVTPSYRNLVDNDYANTEDKSSEALKAVKTGARQGTEKSLSKNFDRYGPGGVRSRSETLQGSVDCQRAGLFRHPTQCNKFYSCRWDCTKKKFTLHVFNCPVHLTFDDSMGACNWPSQGPACVDGTLITGE